MPDSEKALAVFIDFENLALGFQGRRDRFDIERVLERLVEKGKIVAKKAYADWSRFAPYTAPLHEAAIELVEIPRRSQTGKNSADIHLCVDAMDLAYSKEHINTFVIVSGDSDFSPLVSKLKENGKHVIGLGMQESTSELLRDNCDEFIYYEDLGKAPTLAPTINPQLPESKRKAFALLLESLLALRRENKEVLWSSMIKDTIKRKKPSFNESYHGYRTFSELLEDAEKEGLIELETDKRSGTYVVKRFGAEMNAPPVAAPEKKASRRRRSGGRRKPRPGSHPASQHSQSEPATEPTPSADDHSDHNSAGPIQAVEDIPF
ncbi:MAG TPA: NYN domain-containing protein [Gemmataceae bacterium]|nr:NYN domain-containing protein [Gemmataceae bacterium]